MTNEETIGHSSRKKIRAKYGTPIFRVPCRCDPPESGPNCNHHCMDISILYTLTGEALEMSYTIAAGWLTHYQEQLGWVESDLRVIKEGLRLRRNRLMMEVAHSSVKRVYKDHQEAAAFQNSESLRRDTQVMLGLEAEAAVLERLVQYWDTAWRTISRQISMRDEGRRDE